MAYIVNRSAWTGLVSVGLYSLYSIPNNTAMDDDVSHPPIPTGLQAGLKLANRSHKDHQLPNISMTETKTEALGSRLNPRIPNVRVVDREVSQDPMPMCSPDTRKKYIQQQCEAESMRKKLNESRPCFGKYVYFIVDDARRFAYCIVQKAASTSTTLMLLKHRRRKQYKRRPYHKKMRAFRTMSRFSALRPVHISKRRTITGYTKLIIIRNPFDRLVSAFYDTMSGKRPFFHLYPRSDYAENPITFPEFISFILADGDITTNRNVHWAPYAIETAICKANYDKIYRIENFPAEQIDLFKQMGIMSYGEAHLNKGPRTVSENRVSNSTFLPRYLAEYKDVPESDIAKLREYYQLELELFGYGFDERSYMTSCRIIAEDGKPCC